MFSKVLHHCFYEVVSAALKPTFKQYIQSGFTPLFPIWFSSCNFGMNAIMFPVGLSQMFNHLFSRVLHHCFQPGFHRVSSVWAQRSFVDRLKSKVLNHTSSRVLQHCLETGFHRVYSL